LLLELVDGPAELGLGLRLPLLLVVEHAQVDEGRDEVRVDVKGRAIGLLGLARLREIGVDHAAVEVGAGLIAQRVLAHKVLGQRRLEGRAVRLVEPPARHAGKHPGRLGADCAERVVQSRAEARQQLLGRQVLEASHGGRTHEPIRVGERFCRRGLGLGMLVVPQQGHGPGPDDGPVFLAADHGGQGVDGLRPPLAPRVHGKSEVGGLFALGVPLLHQGGRPLRRLPLRLVVVAAVAGVGDAEGHGQLRAGNAQTVVAPRVHPHVVPVRHVAVDAEAARLGGLRVVVVRDGVVGGGQVALAAKPGVGEAAPLAVVGELHPRRVRIVAVRAADLLVEHLALEERAVLVHLLENLPVRIVQLAVDELGHVVVEQRLAWPRVGMHDPAMGVAGGAGVDLDAVVGVLELG